jgi:hypothetical protein
MVVIAKRVGRLANRLLLFSHFMGAALEHGFTVLNPAFGPEHSRYFPAIDRDLLARYPPGRALPPFPGGRRLTYMLARTADDLLNLLQRRGADVGLVRLRRSERLDLNSPAFLDVVHRHRIVLVHDWFFRNADNVERHREAIRRHLTPWERHLAAGRRAVERARRHGGLVLGVHVRRADYWKFKGGRFYYSPAQYRQLMEAAAAAYGSVDVSYLVCSDEPLPGRLRSGLDVTPGPGNEIEDLYALAQCDLLLGPPSTYSRWASFWGDVPLYVVSDPDAPFDATSFHVTVGLDWEHDPARRADSAPTAPANAAGERRGG